MEVRSASNDAATTSSTGSRSDDSDDDSMMDLTLVQIEEKIHSSEEVQKEMDTAETGSVPIASSTNNGSVTNTNVIPAVVRQNVEPRLNSKLDDGEDGVLMMDVEGESDPTVQLLDEIDKECDELRCQSWTATLPFPVHITIQTDPMEPVQQQVYLEHDIFDLVGDSSTNLGTQVIARFDPGEYPVLSASGTINDNKKSFDKLCSDLKLVSLQKGSCTLTSKNCHRCVVQNSTARVGSTE